MNISEIILVIEAAEQLIPALVSFVNRVHPPTTDAPTRAAAVLAATSNALQVAGVAAETVGAMQSTLAAAATTATATTVIPVSTAQTAVTG